MQAQSSWTMGEDPQSDCAALGEESGVKNRTDWVRSEPEVKNEPIVRSPVETHLQLSAFFIAGGWVFLEVLRVR